VLTFHVSFVVLSTDIRNSFLVHLNIPYDQCHGSIDSFICNFYSIL